MIQIKKVCNGVLTDKHEDIELILDRLEKETLGEFICEKKGCHWWLAYEKKEPVAYAGLYYFNDVENSAFLYRCGVLKSARGQGLQRRFIRIRENQAKRDGIRRIITYTSYDNVHSANNLIKCGYQLYVPKFSWGVKYALYFRKFI